MIVAVALVQLLQHGVSALRRSRKTVSVAAVSGCLLRMDPPGLCGCCDGVISLYAVSCISKQTQTSKLISFISCQFGTYHRPAQQAVLQKQSLIADAFLFFRHSIDD